MQFTDQASQGHRFFYSATGFSSDKDSRVIPFVVSAIFLVIQLLHTVVNWFYFGQHENASIQSKWKERIRYVGGQTIFIFMVTRLIGSVVLLGLSLYTIQGCDIKSGGLRESFTSCPELFLTTTFIYTTLLSLIALFSTSHGTWSTRFNITILLSVLGVYAYRDIWPLATFSQHPVDAAEGVVLQIKIAVLAFVALGIPLFIPRRYTPVDPNNATPNPEQTGSLFSMMTYTFLDHTILLGYKVPHLSVDQLDPLSDRDAAAYRTEKAFPHLDVFRGAKRRSLFWGLMRVYRTEYVVLAISMVGYALGGFAAPIGINRILHYMETGGAGATIRPWFWALFLVWGPMTQSLTYQWYMYISSRTLVRAEGLLTQLIFEHSLRVRIKAETSGANMTPADSTSITPDPEIASDGAPEHSNPAEAVAEPSQGSSSPTTDPSTTKQNLALAAGVKLVSQASTDGNLVGKINNLITTDLNNVTSARDFLIMLVYVPIQMAFSILFLYQVLGWSSLVGVSLMIALMPLPGFIAKKLQAFQREKMKKTDARVQAVTETISILRMIKLFGWEENISQRLDKTRQEELLWLWKLKLLEQINGLTGLLYPIMTMVASYTLFTLVMKQTLTPSTVFSSMAVFNMIREQYYRFLQHASSVIQGKVSLERIEDFLRNTEVLDAFSENTSKMSMNLPSPQNQDIGFRNATFTWTLDDEQEGNFTPSRRQFRLRIKKELLFRKNAINLIIGPTGSGKTSILMALLGVHTGEMHFVPSGPDSWFNLPREGGIAYAAQESWVQNDTIRNNILFRTPFDEERYKKVIKQCALERDLEMLNAEDLTEVGERGLTLSGGQKARVTLARAIYSNADIILLDDIFAALDVHTSSWIVEKCFKGDLIKNRTVLLVTHNVALASPIADLVVSIGSDGEIKPQITNVSSALKWNSPMQAKADVDGAVNHSGLDLPAAKPFENDGKLIVAEEVAQGHVTWKSIMLLIKNIGGDHPVFFFSFVIILFIIAECGVALTSWFLGYWGTQYERHNPSQVNDAFYIGTYMGMAVFVFLLNFAAYMTYTLGAMRASRNINRLLMDSVLRSTLRWLDETPTSRIIARFTQDMRAVDIILPENLIWLFGIANGFFTRLGVITLFTPFFIFPGLGLGAFGIFLGNMYLKAQLSVKRETSNARSPMLSHFNAAIHGIVSIRAYRAEDALKKESLVRIDHYTRLARVSNDLNRWIGVRMDLLGALFTSGLALYLINWSTTGASNTGLSLVIAADMAHYIVIMVRVANQFEINVNSLERIQSYIDIEHEPESTKTGQPPAAWPTSGDLRVEHLYARYSRNGPNILKDISFHIKSGQRVGVVGRTGSGKSSLTLALLRCILTEGTVYYDGIPTNTINLDALRSNVTIIPQMPELISGTLRQNLDPFEQNDDATLNDALQSAGLFSLQLESDDGRLSLDSLISGGGANLSVGQRQIIALARAMVRGSKLLILDEATSAIDYKTDAAIQTALRTQLRSDATLIIVAHRLQTIMDCDIIMVLDNGRLVEFDRPEVLLQHGTVFRSFVDANGDENTLSVLPVATAH